MKIVTVIPFKKGPVQNDLTYFTSKDAPIGSIVSVPIRTKNTMGLVIASEDVSESKKDIKDMTFNLKKVSEVKKNSIFLKEYFESALEASKYFVAKKNNVIDSLIPKIFLEKYDEISKFENIVNLKTEIRKNIQTEKLLFQAPREDRISSYKTLIRGSFAEKKSIFIVLPTEHDIKKFYEILSRGIEQYSFALYGGLTSKKVLQNFEKVLTTPHPVLIIATAPYLSIPRVDIGTIIIEHESSSSYKLITRPHIDLRIFVELFASKINAKLMLSDTILRFETIARTEKDGLTCLHPLSFRINFEGDIEILGRDEKFKILNDKSIEEIQNALIKKRSVFIFALRKGLATTTICRDCNETINCDQCSAPIVLYLSRDGKKRIFSCNRCKREIDPELKCEICGSWNLMPLGIGTDTVMEEVKRIFPKEKIFKLDKESAKTAKGAEKIVKEFEEKGGILVGTEMAFSYLKESVSLSVIASFDTLWSIPNYKMSEKIIQIMISMISNTKNKFIIQTKNENDPALLAVKNYNLSSFIHTEIEDRKKLNYPPFKKFIKITHLGDKAEALKAREFLNEILKEYNPEVFSGFVAKLKGKYATNALIKIEPRNWSLPEISINSKIDEELFNKLSLLPYPFEILVDPEDLL